VFHSVFASPPSCLFSPLPFHIFPPLRNFVQFILPYTSPLPTVHSTLTFPPSSHYPFFFPLISTRFSFFSTAVTFFSQSFTASHMPSLLNHPIPSLSPIYSSFTCYDYSFQTVPPTPAVYVICYFYHYAYPFISLFPFSLTLGHSCTVFLNQTSNFPEIPFSILKDPGQLPLKAFLPSDRFPVNCGSKTPSHPTGPLF